MFRYLTTFAIAAACATAFIVHSPTGPSSAEIVCDSYASVNWEAANMPAGTDHYDVALLLAAKNETVVTELVKAFPQDDPPVGFANFYPAVASAFAGPENDFVISVTAKGKEGEVLEVAYSPVFPLPVCPSESSAVSSATDSVVDSNNTSNVDSNVDTSNADSNVDTGVSDSIPSDTQSENASSDSISLNLSSSNSELPVSDEFDNQSSDSNSSNQSFFLEKGGLDSDQTNDSEDAASSDNGDSDDEAEEDNSNDNGDSGHSSEAPTEENEDDEDEESDY